MAGWEACEWKIFSKMLQNLRAKVWMPHLNHVWLHIKRISLDCVRPLCFTLTLDDVPAALQGERAFTHFECDTTDAPHFLGNASTCRTWSKLVLIQQGVIVLQLGWNLRVSPSCGLLLLVVILAWEWRWKQRRNNSGINGQNTEEFNKETRSLSLDPFKSNPAQPQHWTSGLDFYWPCISSSDKNNYPSTLLLFHSGATEPHLKKSSCSRSVLLMCKCRWRFTV